ARDGTARIVDAGCLGNRLPHPRTAPASERRLRPGHPPTERSHGEDRCRRRPERLLPNELPPAASCETAPGPGSRLEASARPPLCGRADPPLLPNRPPWFRRGDPRSRRQGTLWPRRGGIKNRAGPSRCDPGKRGARSQLPHPVGRPTASAISQEPCDLRRKVLDSSLTLGSREGLSEASLIQGLPDGVEGRLRHVQTGRLPL